MINIAEWFGGIGAATQGLKRTVYTHGVNVFDYVELDKHAVNSYNALNGTNFVPTDINNVDVTNYPELDLLIAGWPCQDYSIAGKGLGLEGTRSNLILLTISKIKLMKHKPKHILLENVKGLLSKKHIEDVKYIRELFEELGYQWDQALLNSKYFGVPQSRNRVFIMLTRNDLPKVTIKHLEERNKVEKVLRDVLDFSEPTNSIKIETILESDYGKGVKKEYENYIYLPPTNPEKPLNNLEGRRLWKSDKYVGTIPANDTPKVYFTNEMPQYNGKVVEVNVDKLLSPQPNEINKIATLGTLEGFDYEELKFKQKRYFLGIDGVSKTLRAGDCDAENRVMFKEVPFGQERTFQGIYGQAATLVASNPDIKGKIMYDNKMVLHYRKLSTLECWRLMGFSDDAHNKVKSLMTTTKKGKPKRVVSDSQLAKQAGNSIVVNVLSAIFQVMWPTDTVSMEIMQHMEDEKASNPWEKEEF